MASYLKAKSEEIGTEEESDEDYESEKDEDHSIEVEDEDLECRFTCSELIQEDYQERLNSTCALSETEEEQFLFHDDVQQEDNKDRAMDCVSELSYEQLFDARQMQCRSTDLSIFQESSVAETDNNSRQKGLKKKLQSLKKRCVKLFRK